MAPPVFLKQGVYFVKVKFVTFLGLPPPNLRLNSECADFFYEFIQFHFIQDSQPFEFHAPTAE